MTEIPDIISELWAREINRLIDDIYQRHKLLEFLDGVGEYPDEPALAVPEGL